MRMSLHVSQKKSCQKIMKDYFSKIRVPTHANNIQAKFKQEKNPLLQVIQPTLKSKGFLQRNRAKSKQSKSSSQYLFNRQYQSRYIKQKNQQLLKSLQIVKSQIKLQTNKTRREKLHLPRRKIHSLRQLNFDKNQSFLTRKGTESSQSIKIKEKIFIHNCPNAQNIAKNQFYSTQKYNKHGDKQSCWNSFSQIPHSQRYQTLTTERPRTSSNLLKCNEFQKGFYKFQRIKKTGYQFNNKIDDNRNQRLEQILIGWEVQSPKGYNS